LVIDDCSDFRRLATLALRAWGYTADTAAGGIEGVERALGGDYRLVLVDYDMPGIDGIEVLTRLRTAGYARPVCAVTASCMHTRTRFLQVGFDEHIDKADFVPRGPAILAALRARAESSATPAQATDDTLPRV
jgi:CheY-like chemotaxis protein